MASTLILSVQDGAIAFGEKQIFSGLTFNIQEGDKICLVGKNGTGKSTLMKVITGALELDAGERWLLQGITIGYLQQEVTPKPGESVYDFVFEQIRKDGEEDANQYKVDMVIQPLGLRPDDQMDKLSGGQLRRASLARALVEEPDILLLDEPTNHLDLDVIEWLENYVRAYRGAVICISHDKTFLANISDRIFWLDRGSLRVAPKGFAYFDEWSQELLEQEERALANRQKLLDVEVEWASRGVKARRKRNVRRVELMREERDRLKSDKSSFRRMMMRMEVEPLESEALGPRVVAEFFKVFKTFHPEEEGRQPLKILDNLNLRIVRGDRIGILGRNGSGKTSFLRMLTGEMMPDAGKVKLAKDLEFSYFDQKRKDLKPGDTVQQTLCPQGGEYVEVMGKTRHVCGYLKDFLFDPSMRDQKVSTLSGGQKNRLLLAKVLANPKSLLILDEPTNDLDMDTLDMLEDVLTQYNGTLIVVSHDRDFLDQTISKILAFEGEAKVEACIGGYSDYLELRKKRLQGDKVPTKPVSVKTEKTKVQEKTEAPKQQKKLTYILQYELDRLPEKMAALEKEVAELEAILDDPDLYTKDKGGFETATRRLAHARSELHAAENRWLELEELRAS